MTSHYATDGGCDNNHSNHESQLTYEISPDESASEATVKAVAALTDTMPINLDPLYDVIDPDYLNNIFERASTRPDSTEISFTFNGCAVTVTRSEVQVHLVEDEPDER